jgi:hypothetical protein
VSSFTGGITLAVGSGPGTLSGTTTRNAVSGVATFNDLSIDKAASGYTLVASSTSPVKATSNQFSITNSPVFFGQATDPVGDAGTSATGAPNPDLVWGSVTTFNDGTVKLTVRYASGTFNSTTTHAEFLLDTDQNPATGSPGSNSGCIDDMANLGTDYLVEVQSGFANNQAQIFKATGGCNKFAQVGTAPVTIFTDGMDVTFPLSLLTNTPTNGVSGPATSGPWNFKLGCDRHNAKCWLGAGFHSFVSPARNATTLSYGSVVDRGRLRNRHSEQPWTGLDEHYVRAERSGAVLCLRRHHQRYYRYRQCGLNTYGRYC